MIYEGTNDLWKVPKYTHANISKDDWHKYVEYCASAEGIKLSQDNRERGLKNECRALVGRIGMPDYAYNLSSPPQPKYAIRAGCGGEPGRLLLFIGYYVFQWARALQGACSFEFSQSFQVLAILLATSTYAIVYGYRFWTAIGLPSACFPIVVSCQLVLLGCNLVCHFGVLLLYLWKGGCNGIEIWGINSVLNAAIMLLFVKFYMQNKKKFSGEDDSIYCRRSNNELKLKDI
ncbi:hypothetical protein ACFE04_005361 [Oxalis oulophora]